MAQEYPSVLHRWFDEVWNQKNTATIRELIAEDAILHGLSQPGAEPLRGPKEFQKFHEIFLTAFPDVHVDLDEVVIEGDKIAGYFTVTATQKGDFLNMPRSDKKVKFAGSGVCRMKDGKFAEVWNVIDMQKVQYDIDPNTPDVQ